jgi:hypothetical protein
MPLTAEEVISKYRDLAGLVLPAQEAERLSQLALTLEAQKGLAKLMDLASAKPTVKAQT